MAGRCHRTYSRKKASAPPISQFDRLINEPGKGTHPVASKTAGHVGKWGITSFTSLRSINGTYGKEESLKRNYGNSSANLSDEGDPFSFEADKKEDKNLSTSKRRKFFKSRDADSAPAIAESTFGGQDDSYLKTSKLINSYSLPPPSRDSGTFTKPVKETKDVSKPGGGGIKLKIFKSRNNDSYSSDIYSSTIQLPSDDSSNSSNGNVASPINVSSPVNVASPVNVDESLRDKKEIPLRVAATLSLKSSLCNLPSLISQEANNEDSLSPRLPGAVSSFEFGEFSDNKSDFTNKTSVDCSLDFPLSGLTDYSDSLETNLNVDVYKNNSVESKARESSPINTKVDNVDDRPSNLECLSDSDPVNKRTKNENPSKVEEPKQNLNLFSTDFDEDEIIDRTNIDYLSCEPTVYIETPLSRADTLDIDELPPTTIPSVSTQISKLSETDSNNSSNSISKKKSIFKSRQKEGDLKKRATYKHKWHGHEDKDSIKKDAIAKSLSMSSFDENSDDPFGFGAPTLTKMQTWSAGQSIEGLGIDSLEDANSVVRVKCPRQVKRFYTVIKNVKKTHQLQESGEFQEFNDDVDYFLDALKDTNSSAMRCLASINLAQKCMVPAFRMHLRAHATVTKFFRSLLDAPSHPYLAECAAMVMFALSQDRLNMDLDRCSLELMLNLLDTDSCSKDSNSQDGASFDHASKIISLCKELQLQGHAKHLKLDDINAGTLAMETLLSLTSKRAGEWFKEELRMLGGVDHLVRTVTSNAICLDKERQSWTPSLLEKLSKIDRCLKVLENVTHQNEPNQEHLLNISDGQFAKTLMRLFWMCHREVPLCPQTNSNNVVVSKSIIGMLITTIKVLINLTHGSRKEALGSLILGKDEEIYSLTMNCLLLMPVHLNHDTKFEIQVLSCCLLLNLVEKSEENRKKLMKLSSPLALDDPCELFTKENKSAMASLVDLFYSCEESAREQEAHTDHIIEKDLDHQDEEEKKDEDIEDTVARLLQKAGRHMEDTLIAAYTALLAGYCLLNNKEFEVEIRAMQPEGHFKMMVSVLKKFLHFMNLTATTSLLRSLKPTEQVVKYMESLDKKPEEEAKKEQLKKDEIEEEDLAFDAFGF